MPELSIIMPVGGEVLTEPWRRRAYLWIVERCEELLPEAEVCLGANVDEPFNRSAARNAAVAKSSGDVLVIVDADTLFHRWQIEEALDLLRDGASYVIPYGLGRYYNLAPWFTERLLMAEPAMVVREPDDPAAWEHKLDSWAGLLVVPRYAFNVVSGYCEDYVGWAYEDDDFRCRLDRVVGPPTRVPDGWVGHLHHPRGDATFEHPFIDHNRALLERTREDR